MAIGQQFRLCQPDFSKELLEAKTLTTICSFYKIGLNMVKRLAVFIFIFVIGSNVLTGTPIYAQKSEMMSCCKSAFKSGDPDRISAAKLCCVVNCPQSGATTTTTMSVQMTQFVPLVISFFNFAFQKQTITPKSSKHLYGVAELSPPNPPPVYLRHSAFLI